MKEKQFPVEYSDKELIEKIKSQSKYLMKKDLTPAAATKYSGRIGIALSELQNRKISTLNESITSLNNSIKALGNVTILYSDKQINSIRELDDSLNKLKSELSELNSSSQQQEFSLNFQGDLISTLNEEIVNFKNASEKANQAASRNTNISIVLVIVTIIISGVALFFSLKDFQGDKIWEKRQIETLEKLNYNIELLRNEKKLKVIKIDSLKKETD